MQLHVKQLVRFRQDRVPCEGQDLLMTLKAILVQFQMAAIQEWVDCRVVVFLSKNQEENGLK